MAASRPRPRRPTPSRRRKAPRPRPRPPRRTGRSRRTAGTARTAGPALAWLWLLGILLLAALVALAVYWLRSRLKRTDPAALAGAAKTTEEAGLILCRAMLTLLARTGEAPLGGEELSAFAHRVCVGTLANPILRNSAKNSCFRATPRGRLAPPTWRRACAPTAACAGACAKAKVALRPAARAARIGRYHSHSVARKRKLPPDIEKRGVSRYNRYWLISARALPRRRFGGKQCSSSSKRHSPAPTRPRSSACARP